MSKEAIDKLIENITDVITNSNITTFQKLSITGQIGFLLEEYKQQSQPNIQELTEKYEKKKEELLERVRGGALKRERISLDADIVAYIRIIADLKSIDKVSVVTDEEMLEKAFYAGREIIDHPDWDYVFEDFNIWMQQKNK